MRFQRAAAVTAGAAAAMAMTGVPANAAITSGYFDCATNVVVASVPQYQFEQTASVLWWIPQIIRWNGAAWEHAAWGEYVYNTEMGAPHAWYAYSSRQYADRQTYPTTPGQYYAVRHWVHAEGKWNAAWAENADQVNGPKPESTYWCRG
jgi:hypothetical protein